MIENTLCVSHNMEVAHRLSQLPGKCQNIHGHSMQVTMVLGGPALALNENGIAGGIDFGSLKRAFRGYIDDMYDHHLLLNANDIWANHGLPGVKFFRNDPTVENLAMWICKDMAALMEGDLQGEFTLSIDISETMTNGASWMETFNEGK